MFNMLEIYQGMRNFYGNVELKRWEMNTHEYGALSGI
jgi:hypothetical protein